MRLLKRVLRNSGVETLKRTHRDCMLKMASSARGFHNFAAEQMSSDLQYVFTAVDTQQIMF